MTQKKHKKLKPAWQKTDIPRNTKDRLWSLMPDNPTYDSWAAAIAKLDNLEGWNRDEAPSRDTYKRLKEELREMPSHEVDRLPEELQSWVRDIRTELKPEMKPLDQVPLHGIKRQELAEGNVDQVVQKRKTHPEEMVDIAEALLGNDLAFTTRRHIAEIDADLYSIRHIGNYTEEQLSALLGTNLAQAMDSFPPESLEGFAAHVKAECPQLQGDKLSEIARHNPFQLIRACSLISDRGHVSDV